MLEIAEGALDDKRKAQQDVKDALLQEKQTAARRRWCGSVKVVFDVHYRAILGGS
jgi:hypothetical protein